MKPETDTKQLNNDMLIQFLSSAKYRVYRHIALILFLGVIFSSTRDTFIEPVNTYLKITFFLILMLLFYINMYILIPRYVYNASYVKYFIWVIVLFVVALLFFVSGRYLINPYFKFHYKASNESPSVLLFTFITLIFLILIAASAAIKLFQHSIVVNQRINDLETVTIQAELEQLKNQINPHFLFNMLNNVNVLTQTDPEKASQVVMKLSDLLRYQLYDSTRNKVLLTAEIRFLEDFLNLEKIRRDNFEFIMSREGDISGVQVSPSLFITFVENAVKHNMDAENTSYIHVFFKVRYNEINFNCINSKPRIEVISNGNGGLGLGNVKRRLELLYPEKHIFQIQDDKDKFRVDLKIIL
ncbi:sensor histidine kinase [Mucilaginibacter sp. RCC_168]|uniref:sensor histidine kinase n=1 Tax=Mucilaginibacter sp. RCC_168 TaxID=3239221 RepID=UPI003523F3E4